MTRRNGYVVDLVNQLNPDTGATIEQVLAARSTALDAAVELVRTNVIRVESNNATVQTLAHAAIFERWLLRPYRAQRSDDVETDRA